MSNQTAGTRHRKAMRTNRLMHGEFYADIIRDSKKADVWVYVIQRHGSSEILAIGSCDSPSAAEQAAIATIKDIRRADPAAAARA